MALKTGTNLGIFTGTTTLAEHGWKGAMESALRGLDLLAQATVADRDLNAPPGGPADGASYIVGAAPSGAWSGKAGQVARWDVSSGAWEFWAPKEGWRVYVQDENEFYLFDGAAWTVFGDDRFVKKSGDTMTGGLVVGADIIAGRSLAYGLIGEVGFVGVRNAASVWSVDVGDAFGAEMYGGKYAGGQSYHGIRQLMRTSIGGDSAYANVLTWDEEALRYYQPIRDANAIQRLSAAGAATLASIQASNLAGPGIRPLVTDGDGNIDDQDAATFRGTIGAAASVHGHAISDVSGLQGALDGIGQMKNLFWGARGNVSWFKIAEIRAPGQYWSGVFSAMITAGGGSAGWGDNAAYLLTGRLKQQAPMTAPIDLVELFWSKLTGTAQYQFGYVVSADSATEKILTIYGKRLASYSYTNAAILTSGGYITYFPDNVTESEPAGIVYVNEIELSRVGHGHSMLDLGDRVSGYNDPNYDVGSARYLRWSRYGVNHEIFDASSSQAPNLAGINQVDPGTAWLPDMPVLMGWNGISTYGVRVDRSRYADSVEYGGIVRVSTAGVANFASAQVSNLSGSGVRPLVADGSGNIDDQDAATFRATIGAYGAWENIGANSVTIQTQNQTSDNIRLLRPGNDSGKRNWGISVNGGDLGGGANGRLDFVAYSDNYLSAQDILTLGRDGIVTAFSGFAVGNNQQVVGPRCTGWGTPTGTPTRSSFATGSVTLEELAERVKALIDDLTTHGLIGA